MWCCSKRCCIMEEKRLDMWRRRDWICGAGREWVKWVKWGRVKRNQEKSREPNQIKRVGPRRDVVRFMLHSYRTHLTTAAQERGEDGIWKWTREWKEYTMNGYNILQSIKMYANPVSESFITNKTNKSSYCREMHWIFYFSQCTCSLHRTHSLFRFRLLNNTHWTKWFRNNVFSGFDLVCRCRCSDCWEYFDTSSCGSSCNTRFTLVQGMDGFATSYRP